MSLFHQAFDEVRRDVERVRDRLPASFERWGVLERLRHPDRVIRFTVRWIDDAGQVQHTPAWRVQHCNVLGPYKGGLRFTPNVQEDELRFLAFEQCLKNALTGLPLGGGKGGARFRTTDHSDCEVMRFCQAFMDEYVRYGGADVDVPAGDIGTGPREIGWLYGRFAKLSGKHTGTLTGKPEALGGVPGRVEATGYGAVKFAELVLADAGRDLGGLAVAVSGAGNVALHTAERALREGARVLSLSDSKGCATFPDGLSSDLLAAVKDGRAAGRRLREIASEHDGMQYDAGKTPWDLRCDLAMPCATQNELDGDAARALIDHGVVAVVEGANMPCTEEAIAAFREARIPLGPGKAANAGGVAVSGFEMIQNATRDPWSRERVLSRLDDVMTEIHAQCLAWTDRDAPDYVIGANLAGFHRLGEAIVAAGPN